MFRKLLSIETKPSQFFRPIDWTAFWGATLISFLVYFFTLGPSVGLEDSGELATAADHLGVPHPPGYPFWSLCCWIFCRLFSWVTYMGQPTPAWAVSLFSAVAGAFAAGCTAMLICRSGSDMLDSLESSDVTASRSHAPVHALMSLAGGLGGALVFAFSPVEWSQATIVEIYSLNALFLMAVFLLSYRWMRKPSDRILWLTAFVFGLGLTNYQVLLMAAVPLAIIILLRDIRLFRDFALICIPAGLTASVLSIGAKSRAEASMTSDVINKFAPLLKAERTPNEALLWLGLILLIALPFVGALTHRFWKDRAKEFRALLLTGGAGLVSLLFAVLISSSHTWESEMAPLKEPNFYAYVGLVLAACCLCSFLAAFIRNTHAEWKAPRAQTFLFAAIGLGVLAVLSAASLEGAAAAGYTGKAFAWTQPQLILAVGLILLFGLSCLTPNYQALAFAIPVAAVQITAFILLQKGALNGLTHPTTWWFFWPVVWNFVMLVLAYVALPNGRAIAPALFFAEVGVSFYAYMPIVSDLRNPPMNWGYPRTWEGFKHALMRGQYEQIKMPSLFTAQGFGLFLKQLGFYFQDLRMQFTLVAAALALVPFALWHLVVRTKKSIGTIRLNGAYLASALYLAVAVLVILFSELLDVTGGEVPLRLDKLLLGILALMAFAGFVTMLVEQVCVIVRTLWKRSCTKEESPCVQLTCAADNISQQWLLAVGVCFGIMSLFLVALAGVKGDIQDGFIQKVKFISSHGMFSLWIGYGLLVGLMVAHELMSKWIAAAKVRRMFLALFCVMATCVALIPIYENYHNKRLVFAMGCAEQNGHTFGWQFGNYQLRGAQAIREELSSDEEPLPNPLWPKEMDFGAVFFGGTDPGRFVPTYMIYSANVRPDVFLITQNALADDTYMSVERDLYGDAIWIPAKEDSANAFNVFVTDVQSGKRAPNSDLKIENGRVQVTGALGVMEINGILTEMMFEHEKRRRSFYVEESYVIQWMYPYLIPHGLIMQISPTRGGLTDDALVRNDMEFWDWYQRRLLRDKAFRRDFAAQKSFSKLRAALAGLYRANGRTTEARQAFREAVNLYPASPEASFRYIQEILLPRVESARIYDILDFTDRIDPNNGRTGQLRSYLKRHEEITQHLTAFETQAQIRAPSAREWIDYAQNLSLLGRGHQTIQAVSKALLSDGADSVLFVSAQMLAQYGQKGEAAKIMKRAMSQPLPTTDPRAYYQMAEILYAGGLHTEALAAVQAFLQQKPREAEGLLLRCLAEDKLHQTQQAQQTFIQAYQADPNLVGKKLDVDADLQRIAAPLMRRR